MHTSILQSLRQHINAEKAIVLPRFFKTGKGEYGEGDRFLGVTVPNIRLVAKQYSNAPLEVASRLLDSEWHECRMCALLILVIQYKKATKELKQKIFDLYLSRTERINNWDLVDLSAPNIVGEHLVPCNDRTILYQLADSPLLWERRIAMVSTLTFIRRGEFNDTFSLADKLVDSRHDLMQKAVGWMLREMGKRDIALLRIFLNKHASTMPRTMLRYAIEKMEATERTEWMAKKSIRISPKRFKMT
ncbi:MAG: DNA alkylation repair protein [Bacteroidaceae bacterium]|nr:DNA alkylation repair protein [Bacteroidaceae bacterium]